MKSFLINLLWGVIGTFIVLGFTLPFIEKQSNPYMEYYTTENAVAVSPHDLRMEMDKWSTDFIIVDLRTAWEYQAEHIRGAVNIPWIDNDVSIQGQEARIVREFQKLPKDKRIIIHCYTHYCMLAKHVGLMLAKKWIHVQELNIGWNEWRYQWDLWNGEGTSKTVNISDYLEWSAVKKTGSWATKSNSWELNFAPCTADGLAGC